MCVVECVCDVACVCVDNKGQTRHSQRTRGGAQRQMHTDILFYTAESVRRFSLASSLVWLAGASLQENVKSTVNVSRHKDLNEVQA